MIKVSATKFRNNIFKYLDAVAAGKTIVIERNGRDVGRLTAGGQSDWRQGMKVQPELLIAPEQIIEPLDDIWEEYR